MPGHYTRESFFRPPQIASEHSTLPATLFNQLQLAYRRSKSDSLFIPIRTMQFQAIVDREEIIFVDSHGGYAHQDGVGGRLIRIAWRPAAATSRQSLNDPVTCEFIYYSEGYREAQRRLLSELQPALSRFINHQRAQDVALVQCRILPLRRGV